MTQRADESAPGDRTVDGRAVLPGPPTVRAFGPVNWRGLWTLYAREVLRFYKVGTQSLIAPIVTALLFFTIFNLALGGRVRAVGDVPFDVFLAPGLVMMAILQNAFANTSASLMISKIQGNIVDVLMPPIHPAELTLSYAGGGVTRGVAVGLLTGAVLWLFVDVPLHDPIAVVFFAVAASTMLSLLGLIGGIWAEKFDHIAAMTNFIVLPLSFLSGTFYSIERLPSAAQEVARLNPFFYAIDGFRYGVIGHADAALWLSATVMTVVDAVLFAFVYWLFAIGYKLKS